MTYGPVFQMRAKKHLGSFHIPPHVGKTIQNSQAVAIVQFHFGKADWMVGKTEIAGCPVLPP